MIADTTAFIYKLCAALALQFKINIFELLLRVCSKILTTSFTLRAVILQIMQDLVHIIQAILQASSFRYHHT